MGYHPETLAFSFPPYPSGGISLRNHPKSWSFGRALYSLSPWIGFDIWHIDPERKAEGQRRDDSCGWFDRRPREYADAVAFVCRDTSTMHEVKLALSRKKSTPMPYYEGISAPKEPDEAPGYPRLSQADTLALTLMVARELELRRWWNGQDGKSGAHGSRLRKWFTRKRKVDDVAFDLALNPIDNLSSVDTPSALVTLIAAALHRRFKPWWKHPRWHVHHWKINVNLIQNLRRMVQRCATCNKRLGFGYCPTLSEGKLHHGKCLGHFAAGAA